MKHRPTTRTKARRIVAGATAAVAIAAGAAWTGANIAQGAGEAYRTHAVDAADTIVSGCVIRFSSPDGSPSIHANAAHQCAGVESVGVTAEGRLRVTQTVTDAAANPIIFAFVQTDETLAGRGITAGASGGTGDTEYVFYDAKLGRALDLSSKADRLRLQGKNSNAWIGWVHAPAGGVR